MEHIPFGDTPVTRCAYYRLVCGLPAHIDPPALGRIVFAAGTTAAITMPALLGGLVQGYMQRAGSDVGPIIAHPHSNRWTYLIRPDVPDDDTRVFSELYRADVQIIRAGSIALPSPTPRSCSLRRWIELPHSMFRPSGLLVADAVRVCTGIDRYSRTLVMPRVR